MLHGLFYLAGYVGAGVLVGGIVAAWRDPAGEVTAAATATVGAAIAAWPLVVSVSTVAGLSFLLVLAAIRLGAWLRARVGLASSRKPDATDLQEI